MTVQPFTCVYVDRVVSDGRAYRGQTRKSPPDSPGPADAGEARPCAARPRPRGSALGLLAAHDCVCAQLASVEGALAKLRKSIIEDVLARSAELSSKDKPLKHDSTLRKLNERIYCAAVFPDDCESAEFKWGISGHPNAYCVEITRTGDGAVYVYRENLHAPVPKNFRVVLVHPSGNESMNVVSLRLYDWGRDAKTGKSFDNWGRQEAREFVKGPGFQLAAKGFFIVTVERDPDPPEEDGEDGDEENEENEEDEGEESENADELL
jgi:hypothetical protein